MAIVIAQALLDVPVEGPHYFTRWRFDVLDDCTGLTWSVLVKTTEVGPVETVRPTTKDPICMRAGRRDDCDRYKACRRSSATVCFEASSSLGDALDAASDDTFRLCVLLEGEICFEGRIRPGWGKCQPRLCEDCDDDRFEYCLEATDGLERVLKNEGAYRPPPEYVSVAELLLQDLAAVGGNVIRAAFATTWVPAGLPVSVLDPILFYGVNDASVLAGMKPGERFKMLLERFRLMLWNQGGRWYFVQIDALAIAGPSALEFTCVDYEPGIQFTVSSELKFWEGICPVTIAEAEAGSVDCCAAATYQCAESEYCFSTLPFELLSNGNFETWTLGEPKGCFCANQNPPFDSIPSPDCATCPAGYNFFTSGWDNNSPPGNNYTQGTAPPFFSDDSGNFIFPCDPAPPTPSSYLQWNPTDLSFKDNEFVGQERNWSFDRFNQFYTGTCVRFKFSMCVFLFENGAAGQEWGADIWVEIRKGSGANRRWLLDSGEWSITPNVVKWRLPLSRSDQFQIISVETEPCCLDSTDDYNISTTIYRPSLLTNDAAPGGIALIFMDDASLRIDADGGEAVCRLLGCKPSVEPETARTYRHTFQIGEGPIPETPNALWYANTPLATVGEDWATGWSADGGDVRPLEQLWVQSVLQTECEPVQNWSGRFCEAKRDITCKPGDAVSLRVRGSDTPRPATMNRLVLKPCSGTLEIGAVGITRTEVEPEFQPPNGYPKA